MKIRRFLGTDVRDCMRQVREVLGTDAVILETVRLESGIEMSAAVDHDAPSVRRHEPAAAAPVETAVPARVQTAAARPAPRLDITDEDDEPCVVVDGMVPSGQWYQPPAGPRRATARAAAADDATSDELQRMRDEMRSIRSLLEAQLSRIIWDDQARRSPEVADLLRRFTQLGMEPDVAGELADEAAKLDAGGGWTAVLGTLVRRLPVSDRDPVADGGVYALVGPTGIGKTTTIAKLAARAALDGGAGTVGLVTTDTFRVAAREQLETFGHILGIPVHQAGSSEALGEVLAKLADRRLVLIDTAGMSQRDARLPEQLARLRPSATPVQTMLALPANVQAGALTEMIDAFGAARPSACILTKTDETTSLGGALSVLIRAGLPLAYVANGQRVPEDLHLMRNRQAWLAKTAVELMRREDKVPGEDEFARKLAEVVHARA